MSDNDSDSEPQSKSNNLGIEEIQTNENHQNNMFSYQNRSRRGSSNKSSDNDQEKHQQTELHKANQSGEEDEGAQWKASSKLSDILGESNDSNLKQENKQTSQQYKVAVDKAEDCVSNEQEIKIQIKEQLKNIQLNNQQKQGLKQKKQIVSEQIKNITLEQQHINSLEQEETIKKNIEEPKNEQKTQNENINQIQKSNVQVKAEEVKQEALLKEKEKLSKQIQNQVQQQKKELIPQTSSIKNQIVPQIIHNSTEGDKKISNQFNSPEKAESIEKVSIKKSKKQAEDQYQKQLEDDLAMLKKNIANKKKGSQKDSEKNRVNKTLVPVSNSNQLEFQQTPETKASELKMITMMAQQKKKQNYKRLKQWDKRREQSLAIHRNMVQILQNEIDKRIKSSIENLEIYTTFLREKAKQEQKYVNHPVINTKYALQNNSISKSVYINCTVILNSLSDQNAARCRKINDFIHLIRNDILRDSIDAHLLQSQKELLRVRQKISNLKAALRKQNTETEQKTNELSLFFNQNSASTNIEVQKDFFSTQLEFLQKASQQTLTQKKLGQNCLEYFQTAINEEVKRSKVIREAMITFSKALEQCYNVETDQAEIQQLSKGQENKLIEEFYSLEEIFDERCLTVFKAHENIEYTKMLTVQMFSNFLKKFEFQGFDSRIILLKQFHTRYYPSGKHQTMKQQNCYVVITVDRWIHLFLSKEKTDVYTKPDVSIKATMKNLELKQVKSQMLDIVIKDEKRSSMISYFWQSKNDRVYRLQFQKKDARQQFVDYISKIRG